MDKCRCVECLQKGVTRLEIIEGSIRKFVKWDCEIEFSFQDNGKTLKIFVKDGEKTPKGFRNKIEEAGLVGTQF